MCLKNFVKTNKVCNWPGCSNTAYKYEGKIKLKNKTTHCIRHHMMKMSGRVSPSNWDRDFYRENLNPYCDVFGFDLKFIYDKIKSYSTRNGLNLSRREIIKLSLRMFEVDHINGEHKDNRLSNLQTMSKMGHKIKSELSGDHNAYASK